MATTRPDSPLQRLFYNKIAEEHRLGFQFAPDDQGAPGIDATDIIFDSYQEAQQNYSVRIDTKGHPLAISTQLQTKIDQIKRAAASQRQEGVAKGVAPNFVYTIPIETNPAKLGLRGSYQKAFQHLWKIAQYTEVLSFLEQDRRNFEHYKTIRQYGTASDLQLFLRQRHARDCGPFVQDQFCTPHPFFEPADPNGTAWPDNFGSQEYETLGERGWSASALEGVQSSYTVKERDGDSLQVTPFTQYEPYRKYLLLIANEFEAIADMRGVDESLQAAAKTYAKACRGEGENPNRPFDEAEAVWATQSPKKLSFTWGPFEDRGSFGKTRSWQMTIDIVREKETKELEKDRPVVDQLNKHFNEKGLEIPEKENPHRPVVVVDTVYSSLRLDGGHTAVDAQSIPNDGPVVQTFGRRTNVSANVAEAVFQQIIIPIRDRVFAPHLRKYLDDPGLLTKFRALHGLAHDFGFEPDYQIQGEEESKTRIFDKLGDWYWKLDEAKSNAGAIIGLELLEEAGDARYTIQLRTQIYLIYIAYLIYQMRQGADSSRREGARAKLRWLFANDALNIKKDEASGKKYLYVNLLRTSEQMDHFTRDLLNAQKSGSPQQASDCMKDILTLEEFNELEQWIAYEKRGPQGRLNDVPVYVVLEQPDFIGPMLVDQKK